MEVSPVGVTIRTKEPVVSWKFWKPKQKRVVFHIDVNKIKVCRLALSSISLTWTLKEIYVVGDNIFFCKAIEDSWLISEERLEMSRRRAVGEDLDIVALAFRSKSEVRS